MSETLLGYGIRVGYERVHVVRVLRPSVGVRREPSLCGGNRPKPETTPYIDPVATAMWEKEHVLWVTRPTPGQYRSEKLRAIGASRDLCHNCNDRLKETTS